MIGSIQEKLHFFSLASDTFEIKSMRKLFFFTLEKVHRRWSLVR